MKFPLLLLTSFFPLKHSSLLHCFLHGFGSHSKQFDSDSTNKQNTSEPSLPCCCWGERLDHIHLNECVFDRREGERKEHKCVFMFRLWVKQSVLSMHTHIQIKQKNKVGRRFVRGPLYMHALTHYEISLSHENESKFGLSAALMFSLYQYFYFFVCMV